MNKSLLVASAALLLDRSLALADDAVKPLAVKPGLWETTLTMTVSGRPPGMDEALAKMSPEQRAEVEASLPKGPQKMVSKACITKEELEKPLDFGDADDACRRTILRATPSEQEFEVECGDGKGKTVSKAHVVAVDPEHVKMTATVASKQGADEMNVSTSAESKWIGADCKGEE